MLRIGKAAGRYLDHGSARPRTVGLDSRASDSPTGEEEWSSPRSSASPMREARVAQVFIIYAPQDESFVVERLVRPLPLLGYDGWISAAMLAAAPADTPL